ncbi:hypothetical protein [Amantichitinum ursilacus]|uniref:Uncharacterized protein n=1 Tax=Amantichitinum ursilacus TaxID=857265 RepID=A0A0N0XH08_9NEIS|nr:hypothetical protein [Amantichitinum ursilacus]KPC50709.1 hypothetical protein WG78_16685 [Amantichitinum ursilacus]
MVFRAFILIACTSLFAFLFFIFFIGWQQSGLGVVGFARYVVIAAGFLPWIVWTSLALLVNTVSMGWPLALAIVILIWHFIFCVFTAHAGGAVYMISAAIELVIAAVFFKLRKSIHS